MAEQFLTIGIPVIVAIFLALLWYQFPRLQRYIYRFLGLRDIYQILDATNVQFIRTANTIPQIEGQSFTVQNGANSTSITTKWALVYRDFYEETFHGSATETQMTIAVAIFEMLVLFAINLLAPATGDTVYVLFSINVAVVLISIVGVLIMFSREYLKFKRRFAAHVELLT